LLFNMFCRYMPSSEDTARQSCAMVRTAQMAIFLRLVFPGSRVQHISDLHPEFALRPHHVWKYDIQSATAEIRRGNKIERSIRSADDAERRRRRGSTLHGGRT